MRSLLLVAVAALAGAGPGCAESPPVPPAPARGLPSTQAAAPGQYIVTLAVGSDASVLVEVYGRYGLRTTQDLGGGAFLVSLAQDPGLARMKELQAQDARIRAVQPNFTYRATP